MFFQKIALDLTVTKQKPIIRTSRKKLGKHVKQNYNAVFSQLQKKVTIHRSKFLFLVTKKDSENKKLPSKWTSFASLVFLLLHSISICLLYLQTTSFKLITYCLSSSAFIFLTLIFFLSNYKIAYIFKFFGAQSCLMIAKQFEQKTHVYDECNNFQYSKLILFPNNAFEAAELWCIAHFTAILRLLQRKNSTSKTCS